MLITFQLSAKLIISLNYMATFVYSECTVSCNYSYKITTSYDIEYCTMQLTLELLACKTACKM